MSAYSDDVPSPEQVEAIIAELPPLDAAEVAALSLRCSVCGAPPRGTALDAPNVLGSLPPASVAS